MIKSVFRLIWKRKKQSFLMVVEIFISFLLLFALFTMIINNYSHFNEPLGFEYENIWVIEVDYNEEQNNHNNNKQLIRLLINNLKSLPDILDISNCSSNIPYFLGASSTSIKYNDKGIAYPNFINTDDQLIRVLNLKISEGRWFNIEDIGGQEIPIVVNQELNMVLFKGESGIGKTGLIHPTIKYKVVGIVEKYKLKGEYSKEPLVFFKMIKSDEYENTFLIKTKPGAGLAFEEELVEIASSTVKDWEVKVSKLSDHRATSIKVTWTPIIVFSSICAFLIINILLGLFGVLLYNINNRKPEIGLRRSMGASTVNIYNQFIAEMFMLTALGIIPGIIITIQFPILNAFNIDSRIYLLAIIGSTLVIYLMIFISSIIPSRYASRVNPAVALHEE